MSVRIPRMKILVLNTCDSKCCHIAHAIYSNLKQEFLFYLPNSTAPNNSHIPALI